MASTSTLVVPMDRPRTARPEGVGRDRAGLGVVDGGVDDGGGGEPEGVGDLVAEATDRRVERQQLGSRDASTPDQPSSTSSYAVWPSVRLSTSWLMNMRRLVRGQPTGEAGVQVVHGLEVGRRRLVDVGALVLEVEDVAEAEPAADRRDAVPLDEAEERILVGSQDGAAGCGAAPVGPQPHGRHRHAVGGRRARSTSTGCPPPRRSPPPRPPARRPRTRATASTTACHSASASSSARSPSTWATTLRLAAACTVPSAPTSTALTLVVPASIPSAQGFTAWGRRRRSWR